jgi:hypothetical protein
MLLFNANKSFLLYKENLGIVNDYYQNIVNLIKKILSDNPDLYINIILGFDCNYDFNNINKTIIIKINYEHTLVKKGGRDVPHDTPVGKILYDCNESYLVRICDYHYLNISNIVIDYSNPNIFNVKTCPEYTSLSKKQIYISSAIYQPFFLKENRDITTLTTFINIAEPRRKLLLENINKKNIKHTNINNCFGENEVEVLLKRTKILINIHQTPHHDTFEELRVLPALECGVIVIAEKSPLFETIPYNDLIIWTSYEDIIEKIKEVIINYEFYHNEIFSIKNIDRLSNLKKINYDVLQNAILEDCRPAGGISSKT